jgi:outer membrane autotransporter protein
LDITTTAQYGYGIAASGANSTIDTTNVNTVTSGISAYGYRLSNGAKASISDSLITTTGTFSYGFDIRGNTGARTTATANNTQISVAGPPSGTVGTYGAFVADGALLTMTGGAITTGGQLGVGAYAYGSANGVPSSLILNNVGIHTTSLAGYTYGSSTYGSYGVSASLGGRAEVTGGAIETEGTLGVGLRVSESGSTLLANGTTVLTHGYNGSGVSAANGGAANLTALDIETSGENAVGLLSYGTGSMLSATDTSIATTGLYGHGTYAYNKSQMVLNGGTISTSGEQAFGVVAQSGSTVTIGRDAAGVGTTVSTSGADADAIWVTDSGAGATTSLSATGANFHATGTGAAALHVVGASTGVGAPATPQSGTPGADGEAAPLLSTAPAAVAQAAVENAAFVDSTLRSDHGPAIQVEGPEANISFTGSTVTGDGTLLTVTGAGSKAGVVNLSADSSTLTGAIATSTDSVSNLTLRNASVWNVTGSSVVSTLTNDDSVVAVQLNPSAAATPHDTSAYRSVTVRGNYGSSGGTVALNTYLNAGGALANQYTDRLLVNGNATGTTVLDVIPTSNSVGGITSPTGVINATEGISVVQVAGASTPGAFALPGGYVTAADSPYQYRLYAYGPSSVHGTADASQALAGNAGNHWDYRLQTAYVTPVGPVDPDEGTGGEGGGSGGANGNGSSGGGGEPAGGGVPINDLVPADARLAVAPQVAAYVTAPAAVLYAGMVDIDTLHRRLGEVRDDQDLGRDAGSGEMFFRAYGGNFDYSTNRSFKDFGYNATGDYTAIQLGGNVFKHYTDNGIWRFGLAGSLGWLHFEPESVDGPSSSRSDTYRVSGYGTYQSRTGWYVDGILSVGWFDGEVDTQARGDTMKLRGNDYAASIETGYPFGIGAGLNLEPQLQLVGQHVSFNNATDADGLAVNIGSQNQLIGRLGARLTRPFPLDKGRVTPYAAVDLLHAFTNGATVQVGDASFLSGKYGDAVQLSLGVNGTMTQKLSAYARVSWQQSIGDAGFRAWLFNAGLRYLF